MITLALDASTYAGSIAVLDGNRVVAAQTLSAVAGPMQGTRDEAMMPAIAKVLSDAGLNPRDINRVVCGEGPGSFTSLRIAASLAKGFSHSLGIPLYSVSSLLLLAAGGPVNIRPIVAGINAMRGEFFVADFHTSCDAVTETVGPRILDEQTMRSYASERNAILLVAGTDGASPSMENLGRLLDSVIDRGPVDLTSWEPAYGRLAEAQVKWEKAAGRPLSA